MIFLHSNCRKVLRLKNKTSIFQKDEKNRSAVRTAEVIEVRQPQALSSAHAKIGAWVGAAGHVEPLFLMRKLVKIIFRFPFYGKKKITQFTESFQERTM